MTQFSNIHDLIRPKPFTLRRYRESPRFWMGVLSGSVVLHLLLLLTALPLILRAIQAQTQSQSGSTINPVEIVELPSSQDGLEGEPFLPPIPQPFEPAAPANIPADNFSAPGPQSPASIDFGSPEFDPAIAALPSQEPEFIPSPVEQPTFEQPVEQPPVEQPLEQVPRSYPEAIAPSPIQPPLEQEPPVFPPEAPVESSGDEATAPVTPPLDNPGDSTGPDFIPLPPLADNPNDWNTEDVAINLPNDENSSELPEQGVAERPQPASYQISLSASSPADATDVPTQVATPVNTSEAFTYNPLDRSGRFAQCSIDGSIASDLGRSVTLRVTIDENGQVVSSEPAAASADSVSEAYRQLTACLVQGWQFNAAQMEGQPVWSNLVVSVQVNLQ